MYKQDLTFNNLQRLICHKKPTQPPTKKIYCAGQTLYHHLGITLTHTFQSVIKLGESSRRQSRVRTELINIIFLLVGQHWCVNV